MEISARQARSKNNFEKHRSVHKLSGHDKSQISGRTSTAEKSKSSKKGKTTISFKAPSSEKKPVFSQADRSCSPTSSPSSDGRCTDKVLAAVESPDKLDQRLSSISKTSTHKEVHSPVDNVSTDAQEKISKGKNQKNRGGGQRKKDILSLVQITQASKKERDKVDKVNKVDKKKRSRLHKAKHAVTDSNHKSKGISSFDEASQSLPKLSSFNQQDSSSFTKKGTRVLKLSIKKNPEVTSITFFFLSIDK